MCLLNEISKFESVKTMVKVEVGVPAELAWQENSHEGVLHLTEGEEKEIVCLATEGYPCMDFGWTSYRVDEPLSRSGREFREVGVVEEAMNVVDAYDSFIANKTKQVVTK